MGLVIMKLYRMSKGIGGKIENFAITTDGQRQLELPSMLAGEADNNLNGIKYCSVTLSV